MVLSFQFIFLHKDNSLHWNSTGYWPSVRVKKGSEIKDKVNHNRERKQNFAQRNGGCSKTKVRRVEQQQLCELEVQNGIAAPKAKFVEKVDLGRKADDCNEC